MSRSTWNPAHAPIALGRRFYQIAVAVTAEVQQPAGLRPLEFGVMLRLHDTPGLDQNTLADRMALDRTTAGSLVQHLEQRGLVARLVRPDDRRARALHLTKEGRALFARQRPKAEAAQRRMLAALSAQEQRQLTELMLRVIETNQDYVRPGAGRRPRTPAPVARRTT